MRIKTAGRINKRLNTNMKKLFTILLMSLLAVSLVAPFALAQDDGTTVIDDGLTDLDDTDVDTDLTEDDIEDAGVSPDSPFYGIDRALERISLALTFDKAKRAEKALVHAEERLAEVKAMVEANKLKEAEEAEEAHDEIIEETGDLIDELESNGDEETAEEALKESIGLQVKLMSHSEKVAFIKARILERQADRVSEEQLARMQAVFDRISDKASEAEVRAERKRDQIRVKHKVLAGLTDEEAEEFEAEIRAKISEAIGEDGDFEVTRIRIREKRNGDSDIRARITDADGETDVRIREKNGETEIRVRDVTDDDADDDSDDADDDEDDADDSDDDSGEDDSGDDSGSDDSNDTA